MSTRPAGPLHELREYQKNAVAGFEAAWTGKRRPSRPQGGVVNRTAAIMATGLGKTVIFSELARRADEAGKRTLVLVHREELAQQAAAKLHGAAPGARIGVVKAERDEWDADIVVGSVPTLGRANRRERIPADRFGLIIADECHHAAANTWQATLARFGAFHQFNGDGVHATPTAGFTATMARQDSRALGDTWAEIVAERDISFGIKEGFLVPVTGRVIKVRDLVLDEVKRSRGDFQDDDLGQAMMDANAGDAIARAYLEHAAGRRAALFSPSVASARRFADDLVAAGIPAEVITGTTTTEERTAIYSRFRDGETLVISSCMVLTEGWDAPWAEVAIMARPTQSPALYIQCVGRVLRPFPAGGKTSALVLDVVGASTRHKLSSLKELFPGKRDRELYPDEEPATDDETERQTAGGSEYDDGTAVSITGELVAQEVSLFDESDSAWLRTITPSGRPGVWFIPTREGYFFLWPRDNGLFGLGRKPVRGAKPGMHLVEPLEKDLTLMDGMAWAERYAEDEDHSISNRRASWRRKPPSEKLAGFARNLRIPVPEGVRQGELSDQITVVLASRMLPVPK